MLVQNEKDTELSREISNEVRIGLTINLLHFVLLRGMFVDVAGETHPGSSRRSRRLNLCLKVPLWVG